MQNSLHPARLGQTDASSVSTIEGMTIHMNGSETIRLLTIAEVSQRLSLGRTMIFRLISEGELPSVKIGSARRVPEQAVDKFILDRTQLSSKISDGARCNSD